ncbi:MAG: hypothetical protein ACM3U1_11875 [Chloroflexota bacterium]
MKISGFTFARNAAKLYYPIRESIESILPICDEFVVALGKGDEDDTTREEILSIGSDKIKIIDTIWDDKWKRGTIHAVQTDVAMKACTGDWLFYVQADEVVHEDDLPIIKARCEELLEDKRVEGLLFDYVHFWGDYDRYHASHGWYPHEIRIVRNLPDVHSFESAQSFRRFDFWENPRQETGTHKLNVAKANARIFHYGWVRPPHLMQNKRRYFYANHRGKEQSELDFAAAPKEFDYGPMSKIAKFTGSHPAVMKGMIARMNWKDKLQWEGKPDPGREPHKHEKTKNKILSFIEKNFNGGKQIFTFKNYNLLKDA